jgi:hypothetical protein
VTTFDLVFLPNGVSAQTARDSDLARVTVSAEDALGARTSEDARRLEQMGYYLADAVPSGHLSLVVARIRDRARIALDLSDRPSGYETGDTARQRRGLPDLPR